MADLAYDAIRRMSRRRFLTTTALGSAAVVGGSLLAGCGGGSGAGPAGGSESGGGLSGSMTWSAWANPGEAARFRDFTKQWAEKSGVEDAD